MKFILNKFLKTLSSLLSNTDSVKPHLEKLNGQVVELNVEDAGLGFKVSGFILNLSCLKFKLSVCNF